MSVFVINYYVMSQLWGGNWCDKTSQNKNWGGVGCTTKHMVMSLCYKLWSFHSEPVSWHLLYDAHQSNKCSHVLISSLAYMVTVTIDMNLGKENCGYTNENNTKFVYYTTKHKTWKHETCHRATPNGFPVDFQDTPPVHPFTVQRHKSWNLLVICASINRFNAKLIISNLDNWNTEN